LVFPTVVRERAIPRRCALRRIEYPSAGNADDRLTGRLMMMLGRRDLIAGVPAGLISALSSGAARGEVRQADPNLYRVEDTATIIAAAREIMQEDWVGVLITIDEAGMPRSRPVGVNDPAADGSLWISTRRGSRKTRQIAANPRAALHFGFDDLENGTVGSYYASFTGLASVHTDAGSIALHGPGEEHRAQWPAYPDDLALIRFRPQQLEVLGKGIRPDPRYLQPQGVELPQAR
jgi:general stress protein 26